jgi:hypothetical protein
MVNACSTQGPPYKITKLPSGKEIKIISIGKISFSNDSPALMLKYQTDMNIDDKVTLKKEVEDIWSAFRIDADKANMQNAIISANEAPSGIIISKNRTYNYVFIKSYEGNWVMQ